MRYSEGQVGRVFFVRIDDGEDFLAAIQSFVSEKNVQSGSIFFLGALMAGRMVTGPEEPVIPPTPHFVMFEGGWEVLGTGTICPGDDGPHIHYHATVGRSGHALTGCLRQKATTYLVMEAVILEFTGLMARRRFDEKTKTHLPVLGEEKPAPEPVSPLPVPEEAKKPADQKEAEDLPGGLAEIIRDLTRRPAS